MIRIPVAKALQMPESTLPVDPYVYGLWLGNGNTVKPEITICTSRRGELSETGTL